MELGNCVRYQVDRSTASIAEDESVSNVEAMTVKPMEGIDSSGFLWIELMDWLIVRFWHLQVLKQTISPSWISNKPSGKLAKSFPWGTWSLADN